MTAPIGGSFDASQLAWQAPLLVLGAGGIVLLVLESFARTEGRRWTMWLSTLVGALAFASAWFVYDALGSGGSRTLFSGMLVADRFSSFATMIVCSGALLSLWLANDFFREHDVDHGEIYPLILLSTAGMVILAMASDLVTVFLGIETMSLAVYILTGALHGSRRSPEAAMKYFLTGAFSTAFLVYGIGLIYGMAGTTNLAEIGAQAARLAGEPVFIVGEFLLLVAFAFKIAAAPFHMWAPDAYDGAPTPVTSFMAAAVKAAGITGLLRVFLTAFGGSVLPFGRMGWASVFAVLAALTMTVGNIAALRQESVKRMLAYSSVAHAGYLLVGVVAAGVGAESAARPALLFYLLAYTFTTVGSFGVLAWLGRRGDERLLIDDWAGLASRHPAAALAMTLFLLSLAGMPPTAGFLGKFYVFRAAMSAWDGQLVWLVLVAIGNSLVSVYYYLRIIMAMYFREPAREMRPLASPAMVLALAVAAFFVVEMGLFPGFWLDKAAASVVAGISQAAEAAWAAK